MSEIQPGPLEPGDGYDVGSFRQGSANTRWALSRYLVGHAVADALGRGLLIVAVVLLALGALAEWGGATGWAVLAVILVLGVLLMRAALLAVLRRLMLPSGPAAARLRELVAATRRDVLRELRRIGLPGRSVTLPLLAFRLLGRRRRETTARLRDFDIDRVVPAARLDEVHLLLRGQ